MQKQSWAITAEPDGVTISGLDGTRVTADNQNTRLHAYCFRSHQQAMVYILVSGVPDLITTESTSRLLNENLTWKTK